MSTQPHTGYDHAKSVEKAVEIKKMIRELEEHMLDLHRFDDSHEVIARLTTEAMAVLECVFAPFDEMTHPAAQHKQNLDDFMMLMQQMRDIVPDICAEACERHKPIGETYTQGRKDLAALRGYGA